MTTSVAQKIFADRVNRIEVSATMAVTAEAAKLRAQGINLVDFGAGEPHFATPRHIKDAAIAAIDGNFTRYTVVSGIPELRKAIVERHATDFGSNYTPDEAIFTTGGKLALGEVAGVQVDLGAESILARRPEGTDLALIAFPVGVIRRHARALVGDQRAVLPDRPPVARGECTRPELRPPALIDAELKCAPRASAATACPASCQAVATASLRAGA